MLSVINSLLLVQAVLMLLVDSKQTHSTQSPDNNNNSNSSKWKLELRVTADNVINNLYFDGVAQRLPESANNYRAVKIFHLPPATRLLAIEATDDGQTAAGILAQITTTQMSLVSDSSWKCTNVSNTVPSNWMSRDFNDSSWPHAVEIRANNNKHIAALSEQAKWIWTSNANIRFNPSQNWPTHIYCRLHLSYVLDRSVVCVEASFPLPMSRFDFNSSVQLYCNTFNYNTERPVIWTKDGHIISRSLPPDGFTINIHQLYHSGRLDTKFLAQVQGFYQCQVWNTENNVQASSDPLLLTFTDVTTTRVVLYNITTTQQQQQHDPGARSGTSEGVINCDVSSLNTFLESVIPASEDWAVVVDDVIHTKMYACPVVYISVYINLTVADWSSLLAAVSTLKHNNNNNDISDDAWTLYKNTVVHKFITNQLTAYNHNVNSSKLVQFAAFNVLRTDGCSDDVVAAVDNSSHVAVAVTFPVTSFDELNERIVNSQQVCVVDGKPVATGRCVGNYSVGGSWQNVATTNNNNNNNNYNSCNLDNTTQQTSNNAQQLQQLLTMSTADDYVTLQYVTQSLINITQDNVTMTSLDISYTVQALDNIVHRLQTDEHLNDILRVVNNLACVNTTTFQNSQNTSQSATRLLSVLETLSSSTRLTNSSHTVSGRQVSVTLRDLSATTITDPSNQVFSVCSDESSASCVKSSVVLSQESLSGAWTVHEIIGKAFTVNGQPLYMEPFRVSFIVYHTDTFFIPTSTDNNNNNSNSSKASSVVNSVVISASINGVNINNLSQPVTISFTLKEWRLGVSCVYWSQDDVMSAWSTQGLTTTTTSTTSAVCSSSHLTNFAVLAGFNEPADETISRVLEIISIVGLSLSIFGLSMTIFSHILLFRTMRKSRSQMVLLHLSIALLAVDIIVLVGIDKTESLVGCKAVAALLLYFLLVSFAWMLIEAVLQYLLFVKVFNIYTSHFMLKTGLPAWLFPAVIVIIVCGLDSRFELLYGRRNYCWLSPMAFYVAFLLPLGLIMMTNIVLFALIVRSLTCSNVSTSESVEMKTQLVRLKLIVLICCFISTGLTWLFALFAVERAALAMQVLFCVFNSLQGFLIFLFLNVREKSVREAWMKLFQCFRLKHISVRRQIQTTRGCTTPIDTHSDDAIFLAVNSTVTTDKESHSSTNSVNDQQLHYK